MTGFTFPGIIEEPGCNGGRFISLNPARGSDESNLRSLQIFESFTLSIDNNSIWRDLKNTPSIRLFRTEIEEINILPNRSITIKSKQKENLIWIPSQLEDLEELKCILSEIKPL